MSSSGQQNSFLPVGSRGFKSSRTFHMSGMGPLSVTQVKEHHFLCSFPPLRNGGTQAPSSQKPTGLKQSAVSHHGTKLHQAR